MLYTLIYTVLQVLDVKREKKSGWHNCITVQCNLHCNVDCTLQYGKTVLYTILYTVLYCTTLVTGVKVAGKIVLDSKFYSIQ